MAHATTRQPTEADRQRVQEIIDRHYDARPEGVRRVEFEFGEDWSGDPAVYLRMFVQRDLQPTDDKINQLNEFTKVLLNEIIDSKLEFWPYLRIASEE